MKTIHAVTLISLCLAIGIPAIASEPACDLAIIASKKGVLTMNAEHPRAGALAIAGGRITAVGDATVIRRQCRDAEVIKLTPEQTVVPGFIDSHSHFLPYGLAKTPAWIDVSSTNPFFADPFTPVLSQEQLKRKIQNSPQYKNQDQKILLGAGYDSARTESGEAPDLAFMNSISDDRPIFIWDASMHSANINQPTIDWILNQDVCGQGSCDGSTGEAACQECLKPCKTVPERYRNSFCDGLLEESMMQKVLGLDAFSGGGELLGTAVEKALGIAGETYARHGFTTGSDIAFGGLLKAYVHLEDDLPLDMVISTTDVEGRREIGRAAQKKPWLYGGAIKAWADGSVQGRTAFVSDAMIGNPINHGDMTDDNYVLAEVIEKAFQASYPVAIHTNGDAAIDVTLDLLEAAMTRYPEARALRNTFIHAPMSDRDALERMAALNAIPTFLIQHPFFWGQPICQSILGPARTTEIYNPVGLAAQILPRFAFHSDAFVTPPDPLRMIWSGTTRKVQDVQYLRDEGSGYSDACPEYLAPGQRVTIERSLRALTIDAAYQFSLEHEKGSLEIGKLADIAILSQNPLDMDSSPDELLQIDVLATLQRGQCYSWNSDLVCPPNP